MHLCPCAHVCFAVDQADMAHKLFVTSVVAFLPVEAQMPVAMFFVTVYTCIIYIGNPYIRKGTSDLITVYDTTARFTHVSLFFMLCFVR